MSCKSYKKNKFIRFNHPLILVKVFWTVVGNCNLFFLKNVSHPSDFKAQKSKIPQIKAEIFQCTKVNLCFEGNVRLKLYQRFFVVCKTVDTCWKRFFRVILLNTWADHPIFGSKANRIMSESSQTTTGYLIASSRSSVVNCNPELSQDCLNAIIFFLIGTI